MTSRLLPKSILCALLWLALAAASGASAQQPGSPATEKLPPTAAASASDQQGAPAEARAEAPRAGSITGRVLSEGGQPVANAGVFLRAVGAAPGPPQTTGTDNEGGFQMAGLEPGAYTVSASVPGYVTAPAPAGDFNERLYYRLGDSVTITLVKGGVITGNVSNAAGGPVVAACVRAIRVRDAEGRSVRSAGVWRERMTDDRGIYRLYGLELGSYVISVGGCRQFSFEPSLYDGEAPTYAPSSTRDTASEIIVRSGEEVNGVDIRYRGDRGHAVSGFISGAPRSGPINTGVFITLTHAGSGAIEATTSSSGREQDRAFAFYGIPDGEYDLVAQRGFNNDDSSISPPRRVTVKGADVTGIELALAPLGSIAGRVIYETIPAADRNPGCQAKDNLPLAETVIVARRDERGAAKDQPRPGGPSIVDGTPGVKGDFTLRNLTAGSYRLQVRLPGEDWYVRDIRRPAAASPAQAKTAQPKVAAVREPLALKTGERIERLSILVAEGAASLRGQVANATEGARLPVRLRVHLVPAERDYADEVLRFAEAGVRNDGTFTLTNIAPGRYWLIARIAPASESSEMVARPAAWDADARAVLRREAESAKTEVALQPCQRIADYTLRYAPSLTPNKTTSQ